MGTIERSQWFDVHYRWLNLDRLTYMINEIENESVKRFFSALAQTKPSDPRFSKLAKLFEDRRDLDEGTSYFIKKNGEDERFIHSCLRVGKGQLRSRNGKDILSPSRLVKKNFYYKHRIMMGPIYRADMWAFLSQLTSEEAEQISSSQLANISYGSRTTAKRVKLEWAIANMAEV